MTKRPNLLFITILCLAAPAIALAQIPPAKDQASGQERTQELQNKEESLRQKIDTKKKAPEVKEELPAQPQQQLPPEKVFVRDITVTGATLIPEAEITAITKQFQGREMLLSEMEKATSQITDLYRKRGYITSRAYLPPQKIENGQLEIRVVEGVTGDIEIKGNKWFKKSLYERYITLKKGQPFNYNLLRNDLADINEQQDRYAKTVIAPGKEPGSTDIIIDVKDRLPVHIGFEYDDFGSRYTGASRFKPTFTHNNLLGLDDILKFQYQISNGQYYRLMDLRYLLPVTKTLKFGLYGAKSDLSLRKEYEDVPARGKSKIYSAYAIQTFIKEENVNFSMNLGFDYKNIFNFLANEVASRDLLRVFKLGLYLDVTDKWGRTLLSNEFDYGQPNMFGGLDKVDPSCSRSGAGGKFTKDGLTLIRLQKMPLSSTLMFKNIFQFSNYILPAAEQFQSGGIVNVRGYPPAEKVGDSGYAGTLEWSFPVYFIPKNWKVPYVANAKWYDSIRMVGFYDLATTRLRRTSPGEKKRSTLRSAGCGLRVSLPNDFYIRVDLAWAMDQLPSDKRHMHPWTQITKSF